MRKRILIVSLTAAVVLSVGLAGAAYAGVGPQDQAVQDQLQTQDQLRDQLQDGTGDNCDGTCDGLCDPEGPQGVTTQTAAMERTRVRGALANTPEAGAASAARERLQDRLQDGTGEECDGTCDGEGAPEAGIGQTRAGHADDQEMTGGRGGGIGAGSSSQAGGGDRERLRDADCAN